MTLKTNKKAALELSMSTIVTLIITIIVFGMMLNFGFQLLGFGEDKSQAYLSSLEQQSFEMNCDNEKVCIETTKTSNTNAIFNMKLSNVYDVTDDFTIVVTDMATGTMPADFTTYDQNLITIQPHESVHKVILIDASKFSKGQYQFRVDVAYTGGNYFTKYIYLYVE